MFWTIRQTVASFSAIEAASNGRGMCTSLGADGPENLSSLTTIHVIRYGANIRREWLTATSWTANIIEEKRLIFSVRLLIKIAELRRKEWEYRLHHIRVVAVKMDGRQVWVCVLFWKLMVRESFWSWLIVGLRVVRFHCHGSSCLRFWRGVQWSRR